MTRPPLLRGALVAGAVLGLAGCAAAAGPAEEARIVVRIAPSPAPADYEVHLARAAGDFRSVHRMTSGQTRSFAVPAGWLTVRIPGLCVLPTRSSGTTVVDVDPRTCRVA